jgi:hypothetical protein
MNSGGAPISVRAATSKDELVVFKNLQMSPVFVSTAYDPSGRWDAASGPPPEASFGVLSKDPPNPDAVDIAPGQTARVTVTFDDSIKVGR